MWRTLGGSSGVSFSYNDYDNDNDNSTVSSHLCEACRKPCRHGKKQRQQKGGVGSESEDDSTQAKAAMKRLGNIYAKIICMDNLRLADRRAQHGKSKQWGVRIHNRRREANIQKLYNMLCQKTYRTSQYTVFKIYEPKEREIYRLPYFPDRIVHHAVMNILEPMFVATFTADTYSCIKGRGIHAAVNKMKLALLDAENTQFCLKLDVKKFYPNVDHGTLKSMLGRKIKDKDTLELLHEVIDSAKGLPIGNYLSQFLANFYLSYFDHWMKEEKRVKYYFRYADDIVILAPDKPYLHELLADIKRYLNDLLKLAVKENYQVFPVEERGIDFLGYVFRHSHVRIRKSIKQAFARKMAKNPNRQSAASYYGWASHCNSKHLLKKLMNNFKDFNIEAKPVTKPFTGKKIDMEAVLDRPIKVLGYTTAPSKFNQTKTCIYLNIEVGNQERRLFTGSATLLDMISQVKENQFPFNTTIVKGEDGFYRFS